MGIRRTTHSKPCWWRLLRTRYPGICSFCYSFIPAIAEISKSCLTGAITRNLVFIACLEIDKNAVCVMLSWAKHDVKIKILKHTL